MRNSRALLILFCFLLFVPTLYLRRSTFGQIPSFGYLGEDKTFRSLSQLTLMMANHWRSFNPIKSEFILAMTPASVEMSGVAAYSSYPPGFLIPVYLASLLTFRAPTLELVMAMSLGFHLLFACLMALLAFELSEKRTPFALALSVTTGALILYLPPGLIFFQNVWWPDIVGLIPYAAILLLEAKGARWRTWQGSIIFFGLFTDWLIYLLAIGLIVTRLASEGSTWKVKIRASTSLALNVIAAATITLCLVATTGSFFELLRKAKSRIGYEPGNAGNLILKNIPVTSWKGNVLTFWSIHGVSFLGTAGVSLFFLLTLASLFAIARRKKTSINEVMLLATLPLFFHSLLLTEHYSIHNYNILKFILPLSLLPVYLFERSESWGKKLSVAASIGLCLCLLGLTFPFAMSVYSETRSVRPEIKREAEFVRAQTGYSDVVFSPDLPLDNNLRDIELRTNSLAMAVANKRVYLARELPDVVAFLEANKRFHTLDNPDEYAIRVIGLVSNKSLHSYWRQLSEPQEIISQDGQFYLLRLYRKSYLPPKSG